MIGREADRLVSPTGAEPHDQAEVAEEHERRKDDHLCQRALAGGFGDGGNFLRLGLGKRREFRGVQGAVGSEEIRVGFRDGLVDSGRLGLDR